MAFELVEACYSYPPFQTRGWIDAHFPETPENYHNGKNASRIVGEFHEQIVAHASGGRVIGSTSRAVCDVLLPDARQFEVKAGHLRNPGGARVWVISPQQHEAMKALDDESLTYAYLALFAYLVPDSSPEPATAQYGKYVIQCYQSLFVIIMRYIDCIKLDEKKKLRYVESDGYGRLLLPFSVVGDLIKIRNDDSTIYGNISPFSPSGEVFMNMRGVSQKVRNVILGIGVNPLDLCPNFSIPEWGKRHKSTPRPHIFGLPKIEQTESPF